MEKRRHPRFKIDAPMWVWSIASDAARAIQGHCFNLSEGGAGAIITCPWQPGQVVKMQLNVSDLEPIIVEARLSHRSRHYCGFQFLGASDSVITQLRNVCSAAA